MAALVDYDSASDSDAGGDETVGCGDSLPSAALLLSEGGTSVPDFLSKSTTGVDYKAMATAFAGKAAQDEQLAAAAAAESSDGKSPAAHSAKKAGVVAKLQPPSAPATKSTAAAAASDHKRKGRDEPSGGKPDFKERTKHQRLAGQSGIGSDFRTWRTDQEMALRQQFDG